MTSPYEDQHFGAQFLEDVIDYVKNNFTPEEIFGFDTLKEDISHEYYPEDLFLPEQLETWAKENGYVQEE